MDWPQVLTIVGSNVALIGTTIALFTHLDNKSERKFEESGKRMDVLRMETNATMEEMRKETNAILKAIQDEMKDFHGRLCAIEERNKANRNN